MIGFGCMRLSTAADRDDGRAVEVIRAALAAGATWLDTADAYCLDEGDVGHNERLVAQALAGWGGEVTVATKVGLTRPGGRWVPCGKAKYIAAACDASRRALGVDCIDVYQLHAVDPKTSLGTSVRALAKLQAAGAVRDIGLCNVTVGQLQEARAIADIAVVQVEISPLVETSVRGGVVDYCRDHGITVVAHSPLGGPKKLAKLVRDQALRAVAQALGVTPVEAALAWLRDAMPALVPIPGATSSEHAAQVVAAQTLVLPDDARAALDARYSMSSLLRVPRSQRRAPDDADGDVVVIMGYPGAGKSTLARDLVDAGYERLNRDARGGRLAGLVQALDEALAAGSRRVVLDNTYATRASRNEVVETAWRHGVPVRCTFLDTSLEDAQINAVHRMIQRYGHLLDPDEMKRATKTDPNAFPPRVQFDYRRNLEPPVADEGFARIDTVAFRRATPPGHDRRAVIVEYDGVLRQGNPIRPDEVELVPGAADRLRAYVDDGYLLLGVSWQPAIGEGRATDDDVRATFARTHGLLGLGDVDVRYCPHPGGPPICWCRKPLPGLGVALIDAHELDPSATVFVGRNPTDRTFAERLCFQYRDAGEPW